MNQQQKEVQQAHLNNEKAVLKALKQNYEDALLEINSNLQYLMSRQDADMQHVIYQAEYQQALKSQVQSILDALQNNEFETVSEYLTHCYEEGFVGTMYDLQSQGIPLIFPIDQEKVIQAIQHDTKLSSTLYASFDMKDLKKKISGEISRGISSAMTYNEIARNISGYANVNLNNAMRIARTEGHRINIKSAMDAQQKAREKGADIVKQWDASLDGKTRPHHRELDGQIRELDEDFEYSGGTVSAPAYFGDPSEDCNCRCGLLQRARWALGNDITKYSPDAVEEITDDGVTKLEKIKAKDYDEFKKKYMSEAERVRLNAQKISEKRKTSEGIFTTYNNGKGDSIRPHSIMKNMKTSEYGSHALEYLQKENVAVQLLYGVDNPKKLLGEYDPFDDEILVYCDETKTILESACTIIHEARHRELGNKGTFEEEVECYKTEALHIKGKLTENDIADIIKFVKENYPDLL